MHSRSVGKIGTTVYQRITLVLIEQNVRRSRVHSFNKKGFWFRTTPHRTNHEAKPRQKGLPATRKSARKTNPGPGRQKRMKRERISRPGFRIPEPEAESL